MCSFKFISSQILPLHSRVLQPVSASQVTISSKSHRQRHIQISLIRSHVDTEENMETPHRKKARVGNGNSDPRGCGLTVLTARAATLHNTLLYRENSISAFTPCLQSTFVIPQQHKHVRILGHTRRYMMALNVLCHINTNAQESQILPKVSSLEL